MTAGSSIESPPIFWRLRAIARSSGLMETTPNTRRIEGVVLELQRIHPTASDTGISQENRGPSRNRAGHLWLFSPSLWRSSPFLPLFSKVLPFFPSLAAG